MWNLTSEVLTSSLEKVGHHHRSRILFALMPRSLMKFVRVHINNMAMQNLANVKQPKPSFSCRVRFHGVGLADFLYQGNARSAAFLKRKPTLNMDMSSTVQMGTAELWEFQVFHVNSVQELCSIFFQSMNLTLNSEFHWNYESSLSASQWLQRLMSYAIWVSWVSSVLTGLHRQQS